MDETTRWARAVIVALMMIVVGASPGAAQGWIEPGVDRGGVTVDKVRSEVRVRVQGRMAEVEVSEWFVNRGARLAEGEYMIPLSGEAVFQGFSLFQGDAELRGEMMDAAQARAIYEAVVRRRADPALIELAGQGLLRARVFPIQPGETRRVSLRYTQVLERAGNALQLSYAGAAAAASARRVDALPVEGSFQVVVEDCETLLDAFSPTHPIRVHRDGDQMSVSLDESVSGRLALFLPFAGEAVGLSVATHRPPGEDGYFMLTLSPDRTAESAQPRDVVAVLDVSGSMSGEKIEQAKAALHQLLTTLAPHDRFRLLAFSSGVRSHDDGWTAARDRGLSRARTWIDGLVADGGTNIEAALSEAFRLKTPRDRLPVVVFLTDGLPSVGAESPDELARIAERRAGRARVFAFGVGHDVNTRFLDRLGVAGRGDTDYVQPGENVERALSLLSAKIRHPVLTDLRLEAGPVRLGEVYPVRLPDVFAGQELVLFGRFEGAGQSQVTLVGERLGDELGFSTEAIFPEAADANGYIPRLWASRKLGHLEQQLWTEGASESLTNEIRALALRHGLPSRYTSYLVQEAERVADGGRVSHPVTAPTTGAGAVAAAQAARRMRSMASADDLERAEAEMMAEALVTTSPSEPRDALGARVFELREGVWTDLAHDASSRTVSVRTYSAAWFDLLGVLPELGAVLRKHENVVIAGAGLSLEVGTTGRIEAFEGDELGDLAAEFRGGSAG
jgi:Ca-activated chloride channel family protein